MSTILTHDTKHINHAHESIIFTCPITSTGTYKYALDDRSKQLRFTIRIIKYIKYMGSIMHIL